MFAAVIVIRLTSMCSDGSCDIGFRIHERGAKKESQHGRSLCHRLGGNTEPATPAKSFPFGTAIVVIDESPYRITMCGLMQQFASPAREAGLPACRSHCQVPKPHHRAKPSPRSNHRSAKGGHADGQLFEASCDEGGDSEFNDGSN